MSVILYQWQQPQLSLLQHRYVSYTISVTTTTAVPTTKQECQLYYISDNNHSCPYYNTGMSVILYQWQQPQLSLLQHRYVSYTISVTTTTAVPTTTRVCQLYYISDNNHSCPYYNTGMSVILYQWQQPQLSLLQHRYVSYTISVTTTTAVPTTTQVCQLYYSDNNHSSPYYNTGMSVILYQWQQPQLSLLQHRYVSYTISVTTTTADPTTTQVCQLYYISDNNHSCPYYNTGMSVILYQWQQPQLSLLQHRYVSYTISVTTGMSVITTAVPTTTQVCQLYYISDKNHSCPYYNSGMSVILYDNNHSCPYYNTGMSVILYQWQQPQCYTISVTKTTAVPTTTVCQLYYISDNNHSCPYYNTGMSVILYQWQQPQLSLLQHRYVSYTISVTTTPADPTTTQGCQLYYFSDNNHSCPYYNTGMSVILFQWQQPQLTLLQHRYVSYTISVTTTTAAPTTTQVCQLYYISDNNHSCPYYNTGMSVILYQWQQPQLSLLQHRYVSYTISVTKTTAVSW